MNNTLEELERELDGLDGSKIDTDISKEHMQQIRMVLRNQYLTQFHTLKESSIIHRSIDRVEQADQQLEEAKLILKAIAELDKRMNS